MRRIASVKELEKKLNQEIELWQYEKIKKYLKKGKRLIGLKQAYDDRNAALEIEYVLMELSKKLVYQFKYELAQLLNLDENNDLQAPLINEYLDVLYHSDDDTVGHDNFRNMVKNHIGKKSYKSEFKESTLSLLKVELAELIRKQQEEGEPEFPDEKDDSNPNNFFSIFFGSKRYIEGFNFRKRVSTKNWYSYNYFHLKIHITEIDFSSSNVEQIHFGARDRTDARKIDYVNEKLLEALKKSKGINGQKIDERFQVKTFFNYLFDQLLYEEFHEWITSKWKVKVTTHDFLNDLEALFKIMEGIFRNGSGVLPAFIAESISNDNFENNLIEILNESFPIVIQELKFILRDFDKIMATNFSDKTKIQKALYGQTPVIGVSGFHSRDVSRVATQFRMPGYPYVLITTDILKEGEDLHLYCKDVYHYGIAWNPSDMEQRTGRIDRINSDCYFGLKKSKEINFENSLQVFYPYLADTLEVNQVSKVFYKMNEFIKTFYDITTKTNHDPYASIDELVQEIPSQVRDRLESKFDFHSFTGVKDYPKTELTVIKGVGSQRSELEQVLQIVLVELKDTYKDFFINPTLNNHHLFITANINLNGRRAPLKISFVKGRHFDQIDLSIESIICKGTELRRLDQRNEIREILANKELELRNYNDLLLARKTLILNTESKDRINWITTVLKVADKIEEDYTAGGDSEEEL
ncbi:MAG: hypothetical protein IIA45_08720 [Bacteroidetes bacterium]|nr:hypothetical protein [Bacteroidota bacterium]